MDTKLKRFKFFKLSKAIAFILAVMIVGFSSSSVFSLGISLSKFGIQAFSSGNTDVSQTNAFSSQVTFLINNLSELINTYKGDSAVADGSALKAAEEKLRKKYDDNINNEIKSLERDLDEYRKNGGNTSLMTQYYSLDENNYYYVNEAGIRSEYEDSYRNDLNELRKMFSIEYSEITNYLNSLDKMIYIAVTTDGTVYTNSTDVIDAENIDRNKLFKDCLWYAFMSKNDGALISSSAENHEPSTHYSDNSAYFSLLNRANENGFDIYLAFKSGISSSSPFTQIYLDFADTRNTIKRDVGILAAYAVTLLVLVTYLIWVAGRDKKGAELRLLWSDKILNDVHFLISGFLIVLAIGGFLFLFSRVTPMYYNTWSGQYDNGWDSFAHYTSAVGAMFIFAVLIEYILSVVKNVKNHSFWRNTILGRIIFKIKRSKELSGLTFSFSNIKKSVLRYLLGYLTINFMLFALIYLSMFVSGILAFFVCVLLVGFNLFVLFLVWKSILSIDEMMQAVDEAQRGNFNYPINLEKTPRPLRKFAAQISGMQVAIKTAVDTATRDERMKTMLITNVSHDLKTPLTSIVNYVDLLKRCDNDDKSKQKYLDILEEKAIQLKHLIEDLTEASKVSTGNVEIHPVKVDLFELAMQVIGENSDDLERLNIETIINEPNDKIVVYADSQKSWRIVENLISNVRKYTMSATRVYIDVGIEDSFGFFTIKNISKSALNIPAEELTQRFVRGDNARTSGEGSGLGLSIAQNLCELQGGKFEISVDGDLFKVKVLLPLAKDFEQAPQ